MLKKLCLFCYTVRSRLNNPNIYYLIAVLVFICSLYIWCVPTPFKIVLGIIILLIIVIGLLFIRVSNSMIYSRRSQKAYMNIEDPSRYRSLDYIEKRKKAVADLVIKEFIEGIQKVAVISPGSPIHVTTHKWIVNHVLNSPEVQLLYRDEKTGGKVDETSRTGEKVIAGSILLLISWRNIFRYWNNKEFMKRVLDPRDYYEVTLISRHLIINS